MGIIRNSANRKIKGRVGDMSYYVSKGLQIARQALNNSNYGESARRSSAQQTRRVKWANLVNFYQVSKDWMAKAFENKTAGQTDYNKFMSVNLPTARIALTKEAAAVGACVADAFIVSQGSLPSIRVEQVANHWNTDIQLGSLTLGANTTVGDFTTAILNNNSIFEDGDQISFVSYQQYIDAQSTPRLVCTAYEVTLDKNSLETLRSYLPDFAASTLTAGLLGTGTDISLGGFAYVVSRNGFGGRLLVSSQELVVNNAQLISQYSSSRYVETAILSYGVDKDNFLDTGSNKVPAKDQPIYISSVYASASGKVYGQGDETADLGSFLSSGPMRLNFSAELPAGAVVANVVTNQGNTFEGQTNTYPLTLESAEGQTMSLSKSGTSGFDEYIRKIVVQIGTDIFEFNFSPADEDDHD